MPRQRRFLCCHSSSFVHPAVVGVLPVEAASASCLEWSPVTLWWACVSVGGTYQKLPLIALLRWFHLAFKRGACCCLLGKRGTGDGDCTIHFLLCQLYSISITVIRSPLSPSWAAKIPSFTCKKITLQLPFTHYTCGAQPECLVSYLSLNEFLYICDNVE